MRKEKEKARKHQAREKKSIVNNFAPGANCQLYYGNMSGCIIAMPGVHFTQQVTNPATREDEEEKKKAEGQKLPAADSRRGDEEPTFFIHPSVDDARGWQIHDEIKHLVAHHDIQEICRYLTQLSNDKNILLPQNAERAYLELVRLGMPNGEGFKINTFRKYYKR